uniref:Lectizyme n=1 Tax=Glossina brevipalpis TaxID=37001 RepID=A0A1A9WJH6_9MUSC
MYVKFIFIMFPLSAIFQATNVYSSVHNGSGSVATVRLGFVVSVQVKVSNGYDHLCVGSIIAENVVLTAAHCFVKVSPRDQISVVGGRNYLKMGESTNGRRYKVIKVIKHEYFYPLMGNDAALLKVKPAFRINSEEFAKIDIEDCLDVPEDEDAFFIGWGQVNATTKKYLELIPFHTITMAKCRQRNFKRITKTDICARALKFRGACDGESGGPLVDTTFSRQWGLLSYGKQICSTGSIYVFTRLPSLRDWIKKNLQKLTVP